MDDDGTLLHICGIWHAGIMFFLYVVAGGRSGRGSAACASMFPSVAELEGGSVVFCVIYWVLERLKLVARGVRCTRVISYPRTGFWDASH